MTTPKTKSTQSLPQRLSLIDTLIHQDNLDGAATHAVALVKAHPQSAAGWNRLSIVSLKLNRQKLALDSALKSLQYEPEDVTALLQCGRCFISLNQFDNAIKALATAQQIVERNPHGQADEICDLGTQLFSLGHLHSASYCFEQTLASQPNHRMAQFNIATIQSYFGIFKEAERYYHDLLEGYPNDFLACYNLAQLPRLNSTNAVLARLNKCHELHESNSEAHMYCAYGLAKVYEQQGQYDLAFQQMQRGAKLKKASTKYQLKTELDLFYCLPQIFAKHGTLGGHGITHTESLSNASVHPGEETNDPIPIFIVGLPRTGTTLLERMLASHSKISSGGELPCLPQAIMTAAGVNPGSDPFSLTQAALETITSDQMETIGATYRHFALARIKAASSDPKKNSPNSCALESVAPGADHYFIDKLPLNARFIGFIVHALPNAKIIFVDRDPRDTGLSNFKMLFNHGYDYSYDLTEIADFIAGHRRLMGEWQELFPGAIHTVKYEQLVADQKGEINATLDHLNLEFEPDCLTFEQNQEPSLTASANQIRQPVYHTSVGNWRHYRCHLKPLIERLEDNGLLSHSME